jgi:dipeptidyl aminopeptidase/acylaminoacyl peptidase
MRRVLFVLSLLLLNVQSGWAQTRRPLAMEDYYRVKNVGSASISPDARWVSYTVSLPVEQTNGNTTEAWLVPSDGSTEPVRIQHQGQNVSNPRWGEDNRLRFTAANATWILDPARPTAAATRDQATAQAGTRSRDGRWIVRTQQMPATPRPAPALTDFERRHEERFKGDEFDWYPFRQDGQSFPLPDPVNRRASEIFLQAADGSGTPRQLTRLGLSPGGINWAPDGSAIFFTANPGDLDELDYGTAQLYRVTVNGDLTRLTDDGYGYSGLGFSPDGRWITYTRSFGTDMIIDLELSHGGPQDLYSRPRRAVSR